MACLDPSIFGDERKSVEMKRTNTVLRRSASCLIFLALTLTACSKDGIEPGTVHCLNDRECAAERFCHPTRHVCITASEYEDSAPPAIPDAHIDMSPPTPMTMDAGQPMDAQSLMDSSVVLDAMPTVVDAETILDSRPCSMELSPTQAQSTGASWSIFQHRRIRGHPSMQRP